MESCCKEVHFDHLQAKQRRVLLVVLGINLTMFFIESVGGILGHSTSLLADSLDMLGDSLVYGLGLYAIGRGVRWQARAALVKGLIMLAFGLGVLIEAVAKSFLPIHPIAEAMGAIGFVALAANVVCLLMLTPHRKDDINLSSSWVCSRNDIISNVGVILAAAAVFLLHSKWPDILVGMFVALVFLNSAVNVMKEAISALQPEKPGQGVQS